jgi:gluconokinase
MANVPGLRSPYIKVGRLVYFGRMLDKIRLQLAGALPQEYQANYGDSLPTVFDARCCRMLGVPHSQIVEQVKRGKTDIEVLAWCEATGHSHTDEQCEVWNNFMMKRGWRDEASERLRTRVTESHLENKGIETFFDLIDADEGRDPSQTRSS